MISKKRGVILVVLVMFLIVLSGSVLGVERFSNIDGGTKDPAGFWESDCKKGSFTIKEMETSAPMYEERCTLHACEYDWFEDDCGTRLLYPGEMLMPYHSGFVDVFTGSSLSIYGGCDSGAILYSYWQSDDGNNYLCGQGGWWYRCSEEEKGQVTWVTESVDSPEEYLVECSIDEEKLTPLWKVIDSDADHDGYTKIEDGDCDDNPTGEPEYCPKIEPFDLTDNTLLEIRTLAKTKCNYPEYSECAICINPGAPEVCGDNINNDCGGFIINPLTNLFESAHENIVDKEGETWDDCHRNQWSCEQRINPASGADLEEDAPEQELPVQETPQNKFEESFSWIPTDDGGYCCGYNGTDDDLGLVLENSKTTEKFICLNNDESRTLVGWNGEFPAGHCPDSESWCWVNSIGAAKFDIFTVKNPDGNIYDVVSNNEDWFVCDATTPTLPAAIIDKEPVEGEVDDQALSNRFSCYQEGNHWSWAECYGEKDKANNLGDKNIKGRKEGEGLYSLFLPNANEFGEDYGYDVSLNTNQGSYEDFYGPDSYFDFTGYDYLNFMVKFVADESGTSIPMEDLNLPADVILKIYGPKQSEVLPNILYLKQPVLGYTLNNNFFSEDGWMHVRVPITDFKGIEQIKILSEPETNTIGVRNVYLSRIGETPALCSGEDSRDNSAWLENIDQSLSNNLITGENICKKLYGPNAWLGNSPEEVLENWASCCGNGDDIGDAEYYSETSQNNYGCWNSVPIADKKTTMNVKYEVRDYKESKVTLDFVSQPLTGELTTLIKECTDGICVFVKESSTPFNVSVKFSDGPLLIDNISYIDDNVTRKYVLSQTSDEMLARVDFLHPSGGEMLEIDAGQFKKLGEISYYARTKQVTVNPGTISVASKEFDYPCSNEKGECLFPVPGIPDKGFTIYNPYPNLYELYFVYRDGENKVEELIVNDNKVYKVPGNILAKKVAQQVVYINPDLAETESVDPDNIEEGGFYGCQAASFIENQKDTNLNPVLGDNLPYCGIKGGMFCAHSVIQKFPDKDQYTTINSWSNKEITETGYFFVDSDIPEVENYFADLALNLKEDPYGPEKRNYSATVMPARNFIPNANFKTELQRLPHWDLFDGSKAMPTEKLVEEKSIFLTGNEILRSEKIAVNQSVELLFTLNISVSPADYEIILFDKDGNPVGAPITTSTQFNTGTASFLTIEFSNGLVKQPMLQLVDDLGPITYYYDHKDYPDGYDARSGLACCPQDYCWNGYACVSPMENDPRLAEYIHDGRTYRCVGGKWRNTPVKWDWNFENWGFCSTEDKCFISKLGKDENDVADFYEGNSPICINNSEYVFDHYCQGGNWSTRTKFLASKLIEVVDGTDYTLYCTDYRNALLDYGTEIYLGGQTPLTLDIDPETPIDESTAEPIYTCYDNLPETITDKENTCINNVCVLKFSDGTKRAFATSLNKNITDSDSFLRSLGIEDQLETVCVDSTGTGELVKCDLSTIETVEGDLWYSPKLEAVFYSKNGISLTPTLLDQILDWFGGVFGIESKLSNNTAFVGNATNFNQLYLLNKGPKKARVMKEVFANKKTLIAEYENFNTPVCEYIEVYNKEPPTLDLEVELYELLSGMDKLVCTVDGGKQRVEAVGPVEALDFLWPQLTGRLRTE
jgi:hypothetical protein